MKPAPGLKRGEAGVGGTAAGVEAGKGGDISFHC
jgi:hypothetical protein